MFFLQAEDGIRDYKVTGVQTCALPISSPSSRRRSAARAVSESAPSRPRVAVGEPASEPGMTANPSSDAASSAPQAVTRDRKSVGEGKSVGLGGRRIIKKKNRRVVNA